MLGGGILLIISYILALTKQGIPGYIGLRELLASFFMIGGYIYKRSGFSYECHFGIILPISVVLITVGSVYWHGDMLTVEHYNLIPYCFTAIVGSLMILSLCHLLEKKNLISKSLSYAGNRTLDILTWHFLSFKAVSLIIIMLYGLSIHQLGEFPIIKEYSHKGWWLVYTFGGVFIPLLIEKIIVGIKNRI